MKKLLTTTLLILTITTTTTQAQLTAPGYTNQTLHGFNILVQDTAFIADSALTQTALDLLETKLEEIVNFCLEPEIIDSFQATSIFMDWNTSSGAAVYHPSEAWLIANGYIPEKAKCIELSNIINFINWTNQNQPYMVMHELAHAYHHRRYNFSHLGILNAYNNAVTQNLYTNVQYHTGGGNYITQAQAYALTNEFEYFAELSEAWFGLNDFFPFIKTELETYDPVGYAVLESIWIPSQTTATINETACDAYLSPSGKYTWTTSGTYLDTIPNTAGCDSIITIELTIPEVNASVTATTTTLTANATGAEYQWLDCGNAYAEITGETSATFTPETDGSYAVEVTTGGCTDTSECTNFMLIGMTDAKLASSIKIYPNPTSGKLIIDSGQMKEEITVIIRNTTGGATKTGTHAVDGLIDLEIPGASGIYLVEIRTAQGKVSLQKILKE